MSVKWKIPDPLGFAALIESLKATKRTSDASASGVSGLQEDIQGLSDQMTAGFRQANTGLQTMNAEKLDKPEAVSFSIPASGWQADENATEYPQFYELVVAGVTAKDRASIVLAPSSVAAAVACGLCPTCETLAGKIKIRSTAVPTAAIAGAYWVDTGKE